jgi:hypothetical protein
MHFHFCDFFSSFPLNKKINLNKKCVEKVITTFSEKEKSIFEKQNILLFFNDRIRNPRYPNSDELGAMIMRDSLDYIYFKKDFAYEIKKISNFSGYKFIIYISKEIAEADSEIFKSLTIAHEFQHVLQEEVYIRGITNKDILLKKYLRLKDLFNFINYLNHPTEIDAFTKAKEITNSLSGEKEVEDFLEKQISKWDSLLSKTRNTSSREKWDKEKQYWQYIKNLNVKKSYDLGNEYEKLWNRYQTKIDEDLLSVKSNIEENKIDFILAYDIYSSECN